MMVEPDGVEVVATASAAGDLPRPPLLVVDAVSRFVRARGLGDGVRGWERIGDGQSNVTYLLDVGERRLVLRRGPRPPLPPSTHDMLREARVQRLLADAGVPVPRIVAVCEDTGILGVPFYLMEHLDGLVVTDAVPRAVSADSAAIAWAAVDALADLHAVDVSAGPLSSLGRPDGYLRRQVERFATMWPAVSRRTFTEVADLAAWLADRVPTSARASVVHGDYRIGNLMLAPESPVRVQAILDWEMATLGDPLADLGYFLATYAEPGAAITPLELTPVTRGEGFPTRAELALRYGDRTGADVSGLGWYRALALFKAAVFCEAIYTRYVAGERPGDDFGPRLEEGVPVLLHEATREAAGDDA